MLIYVDDILITGNDPIPIFTSKKFLHGHLQIKDMVDLKYFMDIVVSQSKKGISISQREYTLKTFERF